MFICNRNVYNIRVEKLVIFWYSVNIIKAIDRVSLADMIFGLFLNVLRPKGVQIMMVKSKVGYTQIKDKKPINRFDYVDEISEYH